MNSVKKHSLQTRTTILTFFVSLFFFIFSINTFAQDVAHGKKLFKGNCAACHKLDKKSVGPALGGVAERRTAEWLRAWVKDNGALRKTGDADANAIFKEFGSSPMPAFPTFSDEDIDAIIAYTSAKPAAPKQAAGAVAVKEDVKNSSWPMYLLLGALGVLLLMVFSLFQQLKGIRGETSYSLGGYLNKIWEAFLANGFLKFLAVIFFLLASAFFGFGALANIGVDTGYQPIQEIAFSHKVHAGDNKIDCQYCHSSAKHSKTSGIPSANVCMNCHKNISEYTGEPFGGHSKEDLTKEIAKIYVATGWDADNFKYKENFVPKPIKWTRVHNLPDFAYYNHSQHVTVAGLKCQKCHGPVEEMHEVYQFSPLTMGWCINCHRETEVDLTKEGYYKKIHEQLAQKYGVEKVTIAQLGGMECGKCHY